MLKSLVLILAAGTVFSTLYVTLRNRRASSGSVSAVVFDSHLHKREVDAQRSANDAPTLDFDFSYRNLADREVLIESIRSTCACTIATPPGMKVPPRASGNLRVSMTVTAIGVSAQQVLVKFADSPEPVILECAARWEPDVQVTAVPREIAKVRPAGEDIRLTILATEKVDPAVRELRFARGHYAAAVTESHASPVRMAGGRWQSWIKIHVAPRSDLTAEDVLHISFADQNVQGVQIPIGSARARHD